MMISTGAKPESINVFARWRPLLPEEGTSGRPWTSPAAFHTIFGPKDNNSQVYNAILAPNISKVLHGESCSFFAYGHSGSGKTHTILGYNNEETQELGVCLAAAKDLFTALGPLNAQNKNQELGIGFRLFELRQKSAFDLLNNRSECHVRQGPDGKVHIRGETEVLEGGKVRVRPIIQQPCWSFEDFQREVTQALEHRETGSSSVHSQSSRTHAVLELEVVSQSLIDARQSWVDRQSELVPVGKHAIDVNIEESMKSLMRASDGGWMPNPDHPKDEERVQAAEAEKALYEARVTAVEREIESILESKDFPCLGAKMVFVDLAGAEYSEGSGPGLRTTKQTPQESQEGRQINTDLLAVKEVMRAWSQGSSRIPFRSSTLTMVLREHFMGAGQASSNIIATLSPAQEQYSATINSLRYASLVGAASVD